MEQEIKKIIEQHLPTQTAGVMKEFVERAETIEGQLAEANEMLGSQVKVIAGYKEKEDLLADAERQIATAVAIRKQNEERTIKLDEEARNLRCTIMETRLEMTTANMKNMESLVQKVFGHPSVSISTNKPMAVESSSTGEYGQTGGAYVETHAETETRTEGKD